MLRRWPVTRFRPAMPIRPSGPATFRAAAMARAARFAELSLATEAGFGGTGVGVGGTGVWVAAGATARACDATLPVLAVVVVPPAFKRSRRARIRLICCSTFG